MTFKYNRCKISAVCLQETWLDEESDTSLFQIDGYMLICEGKICSSHAGLAIYFSNKYRHKTLNIYENSNFWEGQFLEITCYDMKKNFAWKYI